jgi:hypothetical protein
MATTATLTLRDLADVNANHPSTKADLYPTNTGKPRSVSMPLFLYYAARAKIVKGFYQNSEENLNPDHVTSALKTNMTRIINATAKNLDTIENPVKGAFSGIVQASLFKWIIGSASEVISSEFAESEKLTINPGKGYSVITIPYFLYNELITFFGTEKNARIYIIRVCQALEPKLESNEDEDGKRNWSRKIHNNIMLNLIEWHSDIDTLRGNTPSISDITLFNRHC